MKTQYQSAITPKVSNPRLRAALSAAGLIFLGASAVLPTSGAAAGKPAVAGSDFAQPLRGQAEPFAHDAHEHGAQHRAPRISLSYQAQSLAGVIEDLSRRSGIEFKLPAEFSRDVINRSANAHTWADAVKELLKGYNYAGFSGDDGKLNRVVVTGRSGDGIDGAPAAAPAKTAAGQSGRDAVLAYQAQAGSLPERYRGYREGSVSPITLPFDRLHRMKIGDRIPLSLPTGEYEVVHDNAFKHQNGDKTWVGYLDQEGKEYRVVITSGKDGGVGEIVSPDGEYQIDLENGGNYLVNVNASGLTHGSIEDDQAVDEADLFPNPLEGSVVGGPEALGGFGAGMSGAMDIAKAAADVAKAMGVQGAAAASTKGNGKNQTDTTTPTDTTTTTAPTDTTTTSDGAAATATADACATTGPIIVNGVDQCSTVIPSVVDVLVAYTNGMDTTGLDTRLNQLVALTNQAYIDSKIVMAIRLVGKTKVAYTETNANSTALSALTSGGNYGSGAFAAIKALRSSLGADLVVLVRPFYYSTQKNCGYTWINGVNKSSLVATKGYATVSDGRDRAGTAYYCDNYIFAHELGHSFGNVHERGTNAPTPGAYDFAYGWGKSGTVGTIMSYLRPLVPYFGNPKILCKNLVCGVPTTETNSADNAAATNLTGNRVSKFMSTMVP